jgi:hypothetical protein
MGTCIDVGWHEDAGLGELAMVHRALSREVSASVGAAQCLRMPPISYARHNFTPAIIQHGVWIYLRFILSYRDVEDLLAPVPPASDTSRLSFVRHR